ncbi:MAG: hypothetical protein WC462_01785 [archaeon]
MGYVNQRRIPLSGQVRSVAEQEKLERLLRKNLLNKKELKEAYEKGRETKYLKFLTGKTKDFPSPTEFSKAGRGAVKGAIATRQYKAAKLIDKREGKRLKFRRIKKSM